ncbi:MAG TPA: GerMN domain-containing protein [Spirochaetota bacterium]|jgi:spore germination protein GerM|nr:MAG: Sporulation and spore germination [Spirochaetes bacterium ADurb.Bin133]HNZ28230.1 GerMN domain-containing protein [Spirochaetota bacterium]HPY88374.1 GerMN domain-containing protein [Spirochaetota bacterium]
MTRKKTGGENRENRSGLLFMLIIIFVLGVVAYAYKDKFQVFSKNIYTASDKFFNKNSKDKNKTAPDIKEKIIKLENSDKVRNNSENQNFGVNKTKNIKKTDDNKIFTKKADEKKTDIKVKKSVTTTTTTAAQTVVVKDNISPKSNNNKTLISNKEQTNKEQTKPDIVKSTENEQKLSVGKVYFTKINDEKLILTGVSRNIAYKNAPLTETLKKLLEGPSASEEINDIVTNIPDNTELLSAWISGDTAYVNFSKDFENNRYGRESTILQIKQIVFTATEFKTVKNVQILIEGKNQTYLGGEGIIIGKPLSRNDFSVVQL